MSITAWRKMPNMGRVNLVDPMSFLMHERLGRQRTSRGWGHISQGRGEANSATVCSRQRAGHLDSVQYLLLPVRQSCQDRHGRGCPHEVVVRELGGRGGKKDGGWPPRGCLLRNLVHKCQRCCWPGLRDGVASPCARSQSRRRPRSMDPPGCGYIHTDTYLLPST